MRPEESTLSCSPETNENVQVDSSGRIGSPRNDNARFNRPNCRFRPTMTTNRRPLNSNCLDWSRHPSSNCRPMSGISATARARTAVAVRVHGFDFIAVFKRGVAGDYFVAFSTPPRICVLPFADEPTVTTRFFTWAPSPAGTAHTHTAYLDQCERLHPAREGALDDLRLQGATRERARRQLVRLWQANANAELAQTVIGDGNDFGHINR